MLTNPYGNLQWLHLSIQQWRIIPSIGSSSCFLHLKFFSNFPTSNIEFYLQLHCEKFNWKFYCYNWIWVWHLSLPLGLLWKSSTATSLNSGKFFSNFLLKYWILFTITLQKINKNVIFCNYIHWENIFIFFIGNSFAYTVKNSFLIWGC